MSVTACSISQLVTLGTTSGRADLKHAVYATVGSALSLLLSKADHIRHLEEETETVSQDQP